MSMVGQPWCAIFMNWALHEVGVTGTKSAGSQSFAHHPAFFKIGQPCLGCIVVYYRHGKGSGLGHVGMYCDENSTHIWTLGGNENDMVQIEPIIKHGSSSGLLGFYWPVGVTLPIQGARKHPPGVPTHVTQISHHETKLE
jgi:uncharacterized protein (TIGR02594 family)